MITKFKFRATNKRVKGTHNGATVKGFYGAGQEEDTRGFLGISEDVKVGYQNIRVFFKIDADIPEAQKEDLIKMARKYSPVFNTVFNQTPVSVQLDR